MDYYKASEYLMDALKHCDKDLDGTIYPLILANLILVDYYQADSTGMEYARMLKDWSEDRGSYRFHADYAIALMYLTRGDYRMARQHILNAIEYLEDTNEGNAAARTAPTITSSITSRTNAQDSPGTMA